jgi:pyruvate/2-oxoglutarate dehydrogenase complex dihydrolipoamide dehydrogenase (E3) component
VVSIDVGPNATHSLGLIRAARAISEVRSSAEFGVILPKGEIKVDFAAIMSRMRRLRSVISPADGHDGTSGTGAHVFQGRGKFVGKNTIEVNGMSLQFKKAVIASGGRPGIPNVPGLAEAPYTTNEVSDTRKCHILVGDSNQDIIFSTYRRSSIRLTPTW